MMEEEVEGDFSCENMENPGLKIKPYEDMVSFLFKGDNVECLQGMAEAVNKLLTASPGYPPAYDESKAPWNTPETQVAARVLWQTTKSAGCAYTKGCPNNCVVCKMSEEPKTGKYPFTKEVYEALLARRDAGVDVASLTAADIGKSLNSSRGGPWGFAALQCLLLGLLTAVGALGLALRHKGELHRQRLWGPSSFRQQQTRLAASSRRGSLPAIASSSPALLRGEPPSWCLIRGRCAPMFLLFLCCVPSEFFLCVCFTASETGPAVHSSLPSGHHSSSSHPSFGIHEVLKALAAAMHGLTLSSQVCQAPAMTPVDPSSAASANFYGASLKGLKYPTYDGSHSQEKDEGFLNVFAVVRSLNSLSDKDLVRFVVHHLRGDALPWWLELSESNRSQHLLDD
ncbi:hypothetical protein Efla_007493 [Eimeria flavescens]